MMDPKNHTQSIYSNMNSNNSSAHDMITYDLLPVSRAVTATSSDSNSMTMERLGTSTQ